MSTANFHETDQVQLLTIPSTFGNGHITDLFTTQRTATFVATASSSKRRRTSCGDTPFFTWEGKANQQKPMGTKQKSNHQNK